jgi:paired amphipathic helix protein Sin3a
VAEQVLTVQLLGKEENMLDDSITPEEKWSLYVDHFVQLSTAEGIRYKRREPFLKRNLPSNISEEPPTNVETRSGLELKICVNTYKIFFVDNTEDYFCRKERCSGFPMDHEKSLESRHKKFRKWLDSNQGWKRGESSDQSHVRMEETEAWLTCGPIMTQLNKSETHDFQRYFF